MVVVVVVVVTGLEGGNVKKNRTKQKVLTTYDDMIDGSTKENSNPIDLTWKFFTIYRSSTSSISSRKVSALDHKIRNYSVKWGSFKPQLVVLGAFFTSAKQA